MKCVLAAALVINMASGCSTTRDAKIGIGVGVGLALVGFVSQVPQAPHFSERDLNNSLYGAGLAILGGAIVVPSLIGLAILPSSESPARPPMPGRLPFGPRPQPTPAQSAPPSTPPAVFCTSSEDGGSECYCTTLASLCDARRRDLAATGAAMSGCHQEDRDDCDGRAVIPRPR